VFFLYIKTWDKYKMSMLLYIIWILFANFCIISVNLDTPRIMLENRWIFIFFSHWPGLIHLQELIKAAGNHDNLHISFRKLDSIPENSNDYRTTLKEIRNRGEARIMLDCEWTSVKRVLTQVGKTFHIIIICK